MSVSGDPSHLLLNLPECKSQQEQTKQEQTDSRAGPGLNTIRIARGET